MTQAKALPEPKALVPLKAHAAQSIYFNNLCIKLR